MNKSEMKITDHLVELRQRLLWSIVTILIFFSICMFFAKELYGLASLPLRQFLPEGTSMIATEVTSTFFAPLKLVFFTSIFITMPLLLFQLWRFIAPGLYKREKRLAIPLLLMSVVLFYCGMSFAYFVVFPIITKFFIGFALEGVVSAPDINFYLGFFLKIMLAFGLAFEVPIVTIILCATGAVTADALSKKRPYIFLGCFVFGMLLTPPDIFSQSFLAIPMWLLFEVGLLSARLLIKKPAAEPV